MPGRSLVVGMLLVVLSVGLLILPADAGEKPAEKKGTYDAGPGLVIRDIRFTGNSFVSDAQLTTKIRSSRRWLHSYSTGKYDRQVAEADVNELIKFYKAFGYKDVRVSLETKHDEDGRENTLIFHIQEGPRYRIATEPEIIAPKAMATERLGKLVQMKKGDYLTEAAIKNDVRRFRDYCESQHQTIRVLPLLVWMSDQPGVVQVQYEVERQTPARGQPGSSEPSSEDAAGPTQTDTRVKQPPARIGQIFLTGNKRVSSESILAHVPLFPGQILTYPDLQKAESALAELGLFVVDPEAGIKPTITVLDSGNGSGYKDILITVKEKRVPPKSR